ncbi:hypothetical protein LCGC14_2093500 [marine sediment metagenome]|uniref:Uncharacterized protein n=1 Tax=marine sediment metagenome TaxID=412755 RepID=A0A0F9EC89_9ZZZZ
MKLTVEERIVAIEILPKEGDFLTLKILRELREALGLNEQEKKKFGIKVVSQRNGTADISWEVNGEAEVLLTEDKLELIRLPLRALEGQKILTEAHITLYEKFVIAKEKEDKKEK